MFYMKVLVHNFRGFLSILTHHDLHPSLLGVLVLFLALSCWNFFAQMEKVI